MLIQALNTTCQSLNQIWVNVVHFNLANLILMHFEMATWGNNHEWSAAATTNYPWAKNIKLHLANVICQLKCYSNILLICMRLRHKTGILIQNLRDLRNERKNNIKIKFSCNQSCYQKIDFYR